MCAVPQGLHGLSYQCIKSSRDEKCVEHHLSVRDCPHTRCPVRQREFGSLFAFRALRFRNLISRDLFVKILMGTDILLFN